MEDKKPFAEADVKEKSEVSKFGNSESGYTFVEERIISKQQRIRKMLAKIFMNLLVPACVCLVVCYLYVSFMDDDDNDEKNVTESTTAEHSIVVNGDDEDDDKTSIGNETPDNLDDEETLIKMEENIKKMVVVVSVVYDDSETMEDGDESIENTVKHTGVVVSMNGPVYILIPYESIEGYKELYTHVGEEAILPTTVYDVDDATGLALLKIEDAKMTRAYRKMMEVATFEGINQVEAGSTIIYCGNVVGNSPVFVKGSISNSSNSVTCIDLTYNMLITDITMDTAEDGFLFNSKGNLVGIVGMGTGEIEVTSFVAGARALDLEYIINNMLNDKKDIYFGIMGQEVSAEIEAIAGGSMPRGIYVSSVLIDSPAYNAGIMTGDIIVQIDGLKRPDMNIFRNYIERRAKGDTIQITVNRKIGSSYNEYSMTVTLNSRD